MDYRVDGSVPVPEILSSVRLLPIFLLLLVSIMLASPVGAQGDSPRPLDVSVGIEIDQITGINQKAENFGAVVSVRMTWSDPALAFDRDLYGRDHKVVTADEFVKLAGAARATVPFFLFQNQQEQRWQQEALVAIAPDGSSQYFERSTLTLQAPYFDFRRYPFDTQQFSVEIVAALPLDEVRYRVLHGQYGLGDMLGEEAWILENPEMQITSAKGLSGEENAKAILGFTGRRHIEYYALRIFLPLIVFVTVSWVSFFLEDYRKRIEFAGANLLVFVAFNFAVSDSLPQLGYLTFLDFILQWMFLITGAVIVINVILRRVQIAGREDLARRVDNYLIKWIFPIGYILVVAAAIFLFLFEPQGMS